MPAYTMQEALAAERRARQAQEYNRRATRTSEAAQRRAAELQCRREAALLAATQRAESGDAGTAAQ
jgi:hypothetical protein